MMFRVKVDFTVDAADIADAHRVAAQCIEAAGGEELRDVECFGFIGVAPVGAAVSEKDFHQ